MTQQTERDEALIEQAAKNVNHDARASEYEKRFGREILRLLRGDEPAKADRYLQVWKEAKDAYIYPNRTEHESDQVAAAVLRRHFEPSAEVKAMLETFSADVVDAQSRYVIVHQLRASADIQDRETKRKTGWADTNDRACLMRSAADAIEAVADHILKGGA